MEIDKVPILVEFIVNNQTSKYSESQISAGEKNRAQRGLGNVRSDSKEEGWGKPVPFGMIRETLTGKGSIKKRPEGGKGISHVERALQAEGRAGAEALRQAHGYCV